MEEIKTQFIWNGIDLEALRQVMDKPADDAVASIFESHDMNHLRNILKNMAENDSFVSKSLPKPMHDFVQKELSVTFSDMDIKYFNQTHEIWKKKGMNFVFILFFRALPYTYMAEKPANVLRMTKLLETHTERRIFETAQFVFDVMDSNWWEPGKRGILTAMKVRIMHSAMRHVILDSNKMGERWNEAWGKPISQEDMIATNQVFSLEFFKGMSMLGEELTAEEQKAWFHTWKTIARLMGVQDNLITQNVNEAWSLQHEIYRHLFNGETHSGIALAKALVDTLTHFHLPLNLTLHLMKMMLADEKFPGCFDRMLGPSYKEKYPEIFMKHDLEEDRKEHNELLKNHYHHHLKEYYHNLTNVRPVYQNKKNETNIFMRILIWVLNVTGIFKKRDHLIDVQLARLHSLLHKDGTNDPIEELEEESIIESLSVFGGIMVGILSFHFRKGKNSGFRIPATLQENWSLKG